MCKNYFIKNFIQSIKFQHSLISVFIGLSVGVGVSFIINLNTNLSENTLLTPSSYCSDYKSIVGDYLIDSESSFKIASVDNEGVSLDSPFLKSIQDFANKYINTLFLDKNKVDLSEFYIKKDGDTFDLIKEDLNSNEPLYMIKMNNLKVLSNEEGVLSADGSDAILNIVFEFTVEDILNENELTRLFEIGSTYTQERTLSLKRLSDGSYKIHETFISSPVKK